MALVVVSRDGTLCLVEASTHGLEVFPLVDRLAYLHSVGAQVSGTRDVHRRSAAGPPADSFGGYHAQVACRQLAVHSQAQRATVATATGELLGTALRGCLWAELCSGDADAKAGINLALGSNERALGIAEDLLPRVCAGIRQMPSQVGR